ncbi:unnamed protein product [Polarella glacialis]|uniref:Uncharacterized protein n=1 Tax=Polarella glacialis TaxID=89957 RepID=A0A813DJ43_POLGL|nr:unnamed protein product [Polarella glacialis]CAE8728115.1 unnamed protein product [Polarella glacialis]
MGCCSASVLSQVSEDAQTGKKGKKPQGKQKVEFPPAGEPLRGGDVSTASAPPGVVDDAAPGDGIPISQPLPGAVPEAAPGSPDLRIASAPETLPESEKLKGLVVGVGAETPAVGGASATPLQASVAEAAVSSGSPSPPDCAALAVALPLPGLVPVGASEDGMQAIFQRYMTRVPEAVTKTLDCSWERLEAETTKARDQAGDPLEWYWLMPAEAAGAAEEAPTSAIGPDSALGLVAYRVQRGASASHGHICHLSLAPTGGDQALAWLELLPGAVDAVRTEMFRSLPISSLRITLWYADYEDGKFRLNKDADAICKQAGFRWFQLANSSDGKRGQIMSLRRVEERDPAAPEDAADVSLASCLVLPHKAAAAKDATENEADKAGMADVRPPCNALVLAECLRRHTLQPDGDEPEPGSVSASANLVQQLLHRLTYRQDGRKSGVSLIRSLDSSSPQACTAFATECLKDAVEDAGDPKSWLCAASGAGEKVADGEGKAPHALCGGLALAVNWKDHLVNPAEPAWASVAVHATGGKEGTHRDNPVAYLATEDDEIFVMVWKLPSELSDFSDQGVYDLARRLLKEAPPSEGGDERAISQVLLPRIQFCAPSSADIPKSMLEAAPVAEKGDGEAAAVASPSPATAGASPPASAMDFERSRELLSMRLQARPPGRGVLQRSSAAAAGVAAGPGATLRLDGKFLFAVWHDKYDDLEVPLFVSLVQSPP